MLAMTAAQLDPITQDLVDKFVASESLDKLDPAAQFERFVDFSVVSTEQSDTFDVEDVSAPDNEMGIDGLAVIVNGALVTTPEQVSDLAKRNGYIETTFIFVSAKRSAKFPEATISNIAMAVADFFSKATTSDPIPC